MTTLLAVPNWSLYAPEDLLREARARLERLGLWVHDASSDLDHVRTVTAFSGPRVVEGVEALGDLFFPLIDLTRHAGAHPFVGALDVCPFVFAESEAPVEAIIAWLESSRIPALRYEKSGDGAKLPDLRRGGFAGLAARGLTPHPKWGVSVVGRRDFLLAVNIDVAREDFPMVKEIAREIRSARESGDARFLGVRALGLDLPRRGLAQISMNLTAPDQTPFDAIHDWVAKRVTVVGTELAGVIHETHVAGATRLAFRPAQIYPARRPH